MIIRPTTVQDMPAYRALRQKIKQSRDAQFFSDSFERERSLDETGWQKWCSEKSFHTILGAFDESELVGIIMLTRQGEEGSPLAEMEAAWLHPIYRGINGMRLYRSGLEWAKSNGFKYVVSFIRENATASDRLCKALGFVHAYSIKNEFWADGSVADANAYLIDLRPQAVQFASLPIRTRFKEAWPFLNQSLHAPVVSSESETGEDQNSITTQSSAA